MSLKYTVLSDKISTYTHSEEPNKVITFIKNENVPYDFVRLACLPDRSINTYIEYNLPEYKKINGLSQNLSAICENYLFLGKFSTPSPSSIGKWVTYNQEDQAYYIRIDYVFLLKTDYSDMPTCSYLTLSHSDLISKHYHYGNKSKGPICSHPSVIEMNSSRISYCLMLMEHPCSCAYYSKDKNLLSTYVVSSKFSTNEINFSSYIIRYADKVSLSVVNETNNNEKVLEINLSSLQGITEEEINKESQSLMDQVLSSYSSDFYNIKQTYSLNVQPVSISKRSYIASLV